MFIGSFLAGYLGLTTAAVLTAVELGIQPIIAAGQDGRPLYAPYPLQVAVPVMALEHLLIFGVVEGLITALLLSYIVKNEPSLVYSPGHVPGGGARGKG